MVHLTKFCFCFSLNTGSFLIGIYYVSIFTLGAVIGGISEMSDATRATLLTVMILGILLNVLLIIGVVKESRVLLYSWFVVNIFMLVTEVCFFVVYLIREERDERVLPFLLQSGLMLYFILVVNSYLAEVKQKNELSPEQSKQQENMLPSGTVLV